MKKRPNVDPSFLFLAILFYSSLIIFVVNVIQAANKETAYTDVHQCVYTGNWEDRVDMIPIATGTQVTFTQQLRRIYFWTCDGKNTELDYGPK